MTGSSKRVILVCEECDERTVLGEPLAAWYSEGTHFGCECGRRLTIADRLDLQTVSRTGGVTSVARSAWPLYR
jgi:hypothetical protein